MDDVVTDDVPAEDVATDDADRDSAADEPPRPATGWLIAVTALAVLLVGSLVMGFVLGRSVLDYRAVGARQAAILSVARDVAQRSYSLDYQSFPQQSAKIIAETTGSYRQGMINSEPGLQYILTQGKVKSTCTITAAGIERDDGNTATVLLSITSTVTNTQVRTPEVRFYRVSMSLLRQGTQWFVESNDVIA